MSGQRTVFPDDPDYVFDLRPHSSRKLVCHPADKPCDYQTGRKDGLRAALEAVETKASPPLGDDGVRWQSFFAYRIQRLLDEQKESS